MIPTCQEFNKRGLHGEVAKPSVSRSEESAALVFKAVQPACQKLVSMEKELNDLDTQSGDGNCGSTLSLGANTVLAKLGSGSNPGLPVDCPHTLALSLAQITGNVMGGSSGAFVFHWSSPRTEGSKQEQFICCFRNRTPAIMRYGGAKPGYRTMVDPLSAAYKSIVSSGSNKGFAEALKIAAEEARREAIGTAKMDAQAGRASYVNKSLLTKPDPGAVALAGWFKAATDIL